MKTSAGTARLTVRTGIGLRWPTACWQMYHVAIPFPSVRCAGSRDAGRWQGHGAGAAAKGNSEGQQRRATAHRGTARPQNGMTAEGQLHTAELLNGVNAKLHGAQNCSARKTAPRATPTSRKTVRAGGTVTAVRVRASARIARKPRAVPPKIFAPQRSDARPRCESPGVAVLRFCSSAAVLFCDVPFAVAVLRAVQFCVQAVQAVQAVQTYSCVALAPMPIAW